MSSIFITVYIVVELIVSVIILWFTSLFILRSNQIRPFIAFFILSLIQAYDAGFTSFGLYTSPVWVVIGLAYFLAIFLMVSQIIRRL